MKILATIIIGPHMSESGAVNAGKSLSQALAVHCEVDVAIMAYEEDILKLGEARLLKRKSWNPLGFLGRILPHKYLTLLYRSDIPRLIKSGNYDLIHIHNPLPAMEMKRIAKACIKRKTPYVVSTHGFIEATSGGRAYGLKHPHELFAWKFLLEHPLQYVVKHATKILALSPYEQPSLTGLGIEEERVSIVTNGVNPFFLEKPDATELKAVLSKYDITRRNDSSAAVCIYLGNHTRNKGLGILLDAMTGVSEPFTLIVCGQQRNEIDYQQYQSKCRADQRIIFTGRISDSEVKALFHGSDLFVYPTISDTLPLVILEAMACGLPILSTQVGGIPFQVDNSCGLLVEPGSVKAFQDGLITLMKDRELLKRMGEQAFKTVSKKFDWKQSAVTAYRIYSTLLDR